MSTTRALERARAVAAIYVRSRVEGGLRHGNDESRPKWRALGQKLSEWSRENAEILSPREKVLLAKPMGRWTEQTCINNDWRLEALGVLAWALGLVRALPAWDKATKVDVVRYFDAPSWFAPVEPSALARKVKMKTQDELLHACELAELWHWRANIAGRPVEGRTKQRIRKAAQAALAKGDLPSVLEGDFPWHKRAYSRLDEEQLSEAHSIAEERHYVLEWLTSAAATHAKWDTVQTDT